MISDNGIATKRKRKSTKEPPAEAAELRDLRRQQWQRSIDERSDADHEVANLVGNELYPDEIKVLPLDQLRRHPLNRAIDPADPEIVALSASIAQHGQLEPLRVRRVSFDPAVPNYEIISGERRYTALKATGATHARCIVADADAPTALVEVAVANAHRKDLNPIERAELMLVLMRPVEEGGSGYTREQAGELFGLTSESGCKNALRLLQLPDEIKSMVINGELPERTARSLVPYCAAPAVMADIVTELKDPDERGRVIFELGEEPQPWFLKQAIAEHTRPISADVEHRYEWPISGKPCLFEVKGHEDELQIVDLPCNLGWDSKLKRDRLESRKFALNVKLWDKLQAPFIERLRKGKEAKAKAPAGKKASGEAAKLTPAEQKAEEKRKTAEADRRLNDFTREWLQRLLRCAIAGRAHDDELVAKTIPWLTSCCHCGAGGSLQMHAEAAIAECQLPAPKGNGWFDQLSVIEKLTNGKRSVDSCQKPFDLLSAYWRLILWPVSRLIGDKPTRSHATPAGELPDRLVHINAQEVLTLAAIAGVSVETAWQAAGTDASDERRLVSVWLCRHTKAQLHKLRLELGVTEGGEHMGRDELAGCILNAHRPGRPLPVPKRLMKAAK